MNEEARAAMLRLLKAVHVTFVDELPDVIETVRQISEDRAALVVPGPDERERAGEIDRARSNLVFALADLDRLTDSIKKADDALAILEADLLVHAPITPVEQATAREAYRKLVSEWLETHDPDGEDDARRLFEPPVE